MSRRYVAILACSDEARDVIDRGWRHRIDYDPDFDGHVMIYEEQVLPECVLKIDPVRIRCENGRVTLDLEEARWLRDHLTVVIERMERHDAELMAYLTDVAASEISARRKP